MNLYLISQTANDGWDTFDSAVVAAKNTKDARMTHPGEYAVPWDGTMGNFSAWVSSEEVTVKKIGIADKGTKAGVICASFNAG